MDNKQDKTYAGMTRRTLCLGAGGAAVMLGLGGLKYVGSQPIVRPPGGQDEERLVSACIRCEKCYEICPRNVIAPAHLEDGVLNMRTPTFDFSANWCDWCADEHGGTPLCVSACPTRRTPRSCAPLSHWPSSPVVTVGFVTNVGIGTMSAPGIWDISILCPLGALGTMLASKMMVPRAVVSLVVMVLLIVVFARAFCGWMCPVPLVQKLRGLFAKKQPVERGDAADPAAAPLTKVEIDALGVSCSKGSKDGGGCASCASKRGAALDARHFVLGGALASTFVFGFPVFCLVCPIGLTFATILLVINLFSHGDVTWSLIVVPALLIAEVLLFKKWCHKLCPLSAFMSLIAKANKTFVPTIDDAKCLETAKGGACGACGRVCEEGIDPRHPQLSRAAWSECTKCRACVDACPANAITMPLLPRRTPSTTEPVAVPTNVAEVDAEDTQLFARTVP